MANIIVIGSGRMGTALAIAFAHAGHVILGAFARNPDSQSAASFVSLTGAPVWRWPNVDDHDQRDAIDWPVDARHVLTQADLIVIATPDAAVTPVAQTLAAATLLQSSQTVAHCSGATPHTALHPLMLQGVDAVCMHPLQTVANPQDAPSCFADVVFTLDGTPKGVNTVARLVEQIGGVPERIDPADRPRYHAAAVLASNAVISLLAVAAGLAGLSAGSRPFLPLLQGAVDNLKHYGLPDALTGPVERADLQTVSRHLIALQDNPTANRVYRALQSVAADVARHKGSLSPEQWQMFHALFEDADPAAGQ